MKRRPVEWLQGPGQDTEASDVEWSMRHMTFSVAGQWLAVDNNQLLLPIRVLDKKEDGISMVETGEDGYVAILKQYGGESLLNDMLMHPDEKLERGSTWTLYREASGRMTIEPEPVEE